jgi:hypothetical protein
MSLHLNRTSWSQPFDGFSVAPLLHHVEIDGYEAGMNLPLGQLTRLSLSWIADNECVDILKCCPNLSHCTFTEIVHDPGLLPPTLTYNIEYLELDSDNPRLGVLLDALIIPAVSELRINNYGALFSHSNFVSLISRSACTLRRLALFGCHSLEEGLQLCLQAVPSVTDFEFSQNSFDMTNTVIRILDRGHPSNTNFPCLLPNLRTLTLKEAVFDLPALANMLSSRRRNDPVYSINGNGNDPARLESVVVELEDFVDDDMLATALPQLQYLVSEGMQITLLNAGSVIGL